ncbi:hypothetical protein Hanom_Chr10g00913071 [Helianthus anomalus]|nr:hypothetical protein HanPSC8_Chr10g0423351 [Helianthus annuus]
MVSNLVTARVPNPRTIEALIALLANLSIPSDPSPTTPLSLSLPFCSSATTSLSSAIDFITGYTL